MTDFKSGDVLLVGEACSVQFAGNRALRLRLVSVDPAPTYQGWIWLTGYVLNKSGDATDKREVFVQRAGIRIEARSALLTPRLTPRRAIAHTSSRRPRAKPA